MAISEKDREFMKKVASYFRSTKLDSGGDGSIKDTANKFQINRNKVRKILVTMGEMESSITKEALKLRKKGMRIREIAEKLSVSTATVSVALPYEDKVNHTLEPTKHAAEVRNYRIYEKKQANRQIKRQTDHQKNNQKISLNPQKTMASCSNENRIQKKKNGNIRSLETKEWQKDQKGLTPEEKCRRRSYLCLKAGQFSGALYHRDRGILEQIAGGHLPAEPEEVLRLHLELYSDFPDEDEIDILRRYGKLEHGNNISRDIIVPADIPLYALHYMIQKAFGWENSHLHQFELPEDRFKAITQDNASTWSRLVGILFRSPIMEEGDEFWADDYEKGSFKNWLRKKYTGPYLSQCHGEGILACREDMAKLDMEAEYYVLYVKTYDPKTKRYDGEEYIAGAISVYEKEGHKRKEPKPWFGEDIPHRVETMKLKKLPSEALKFLCERNPMALLERLPLNSILAAGLFELPGECGMEEQVYISGQMTDSGELLYRRLQKKIERIVKEGIDFPEVQVYPTPVTDTLLYHYDFGDNWKVRLTASRNCPDLVNCGRITQTELDRANVKCRETYRPVMIARDGEMLVDDAGGIHGFAEFLKQINPELDGLNPDEKKRVQKIKGEYLWWAENQGWHRDHSTNLNFL